MPNNSIKRIFSLDLRSLALFRIGFAIILICDQISRLSVLDVFYSDQGALPQSLMTNWISFPWNSSFYFWSDNLTFQTLILIIEFLFSFMMLVGFQTRIATFFAWLFLCSAQARNPIVLHFGDDLLRLMLFWSMFLPTNVFFSIDSMANKNEPTQNTTSYFSIASAGFILQLIYVYFFTAMIKWVPVWQTTGDALYYAISNDHLVTPLGFWLRSWSRTILQNLTIFTFWFEVIGPLCILLPFKNNKFRLYVPLFFILFHLSLELTFYLGLFAQICVWSWIALLHEGFWDQVKRHFDQITLSCDRLFSKQFFISIRKVTKPPNLHMSRPAQLVSGLALIFVTIINVLLLPPNRTLPQEVQTIANITKLNQFWSMFAPQPIDWDGWFIFEGIKVNHETVDLFRKKNVSDPVHAADIDSDMKGHLGYTKWAQFLQGLYFHGDNQAYQNLINWMCRKWARQNSIENKLTTINVHFYFKKTPEPESSLIPIEVNNLGVFNCLE